ncbi:MAG: hypothetical protein AAFX99_06965 [Myxococcota bacterium]
MTSATAKWTKTLHSTMVWEWYLQESDLLALTGDLSTLPGPVADARAQKAAVVWVKRTLDKEPSHNRWWRSKTNIGWLDKLLTVARLKELANTRIVKVGKKSGLRYDIAGLGQTFYGRKILKGLGFSRQRTRATKEEFARIQQACAKIKLRLPETVEPTTTERFFNPPPQAEATP